MQMSEKGGEGTMVWRDLRQLGGNRAWMRAAAAAQAQVRHERGATGEERARSRGSRRMGWM